jgi:hypothetical protein
MDQVDLGFCNVDKEATILSDGLSVYGEAILSSVREKGLVAARIIDKSCLARSTFVLRFRIFSEVASTVIVSVTHDYLEQIRFFAICVLVEFGED